MTMRTQKTKRLSELHFVSTKQTKTEEEHQVLRRREVYS